MTDCLTFAPSTLLPSTWGSSFFWISSIDGAKNQTITEIVNSKILNEDMNIAFISLRHNYQNSLIYYPWYHFAIRNKIKENNNTIH